MSRVTWTKRDLAESINQRVDRGQIYGDLILPEDITDNALEEFQNNWEFGLNDPSVYERLFVRVHQSVTGGF